MLHIKDYRELGQSGMVGFDAIFNNADVAGLENYIVEIEAFTNGDWRESLKMCADYIINAPFVKASYEK
jgi:sugar phosphate isomerase/epimerase